MESTKQVVATQQLKYRKQKAVVADLLETLELKPQTDIFVYSDFPIGWHATVAAADRVWIFISRSWGIDLEIQPIRGFWPNGALIIK